MSRADDFNLTAEELRSRQRQRRRILAWTGAITVALVIVLFAARPVGHAIKGWQSRRHAERAFALINRENWSEAQKEATAAYQLAPNEREAIRAVARFLSRVQQPQAFEFWDKLAGLQPLTHADLRDEAGVALALGETGRAAAALKPLLAGQRGAAGPADWLLEAQLAAALSSPNELAAALQKVFNDPAASGREQLEAALLELRAVSAGAEQPQKKEAEAWQRIVRLSAGKDAAGLDALVLLAQRELQSAGGTGSVPSANRNTDATEGIPPASALANALASHPLSKTPQHLLAVDLRIEASPNDKDKLVQGAIERWKNAGDDALLSLTKWLNGRGEYARELATVPLERALQNRGLFLQRLDALGALGRWEEIRRLLEGERFPLDPTIERMYLARCDAQLGRTVGSANNWQRALEAATGDAQKLMTLAEYAEKNGASALAASAYDGAIAASPKLRPAWQGKLRLAQATRDTRAIHTALTGMRELWPNDTAVENDEAYTRLLLAGAKDEGRRMKDEKGNADHGTGSAEPITNNKELITDERLAETLVKREPHSLPHRTLLALVLLRENRPYTALEVYRDLNVSAGALTPSALAVHAAVLAATGDSAGAHEEAGRIPRDQLLPEERALLEKQ